MMRAILTCLLLGLGNLVAAEVSAGLSSNRLQVGEGARLTIRVEGGRPESAPLIPAVEGLVVNPQGRSQEMQFINGRVSRAISFNYVVGSHEAGEYEVPPLKVRVDGEELTTQALKITVLPAADGAPAGMEEDGEAAPAPVEETEFGHLTFQLASKDRQHVYPGEIAPVRIKAYFPDGARVSLDGAPRPEGSAFTLHNLTQEPQQSVEVIEGARYRVVTWYGGLSATKAGSYPAGFTLGATVAVRDPSARRRPSPFDDPFFGGSMMDDFFAPMIQKEVELTIEDAPVLEVRELPLEGRPEGFSGAIGSFGFESVELPAELRTGEPFQVEAVVSGSGNFSLLKEPRPLPAEDWKVYDGSGDFRPGDAASFGGSKVFRFNAVPLVAGEREVALGFSYFDPETGEYRTVESEARAVRISGEPVLREEPADERVAAEPAGPQLAPLRRDLGPVRSFEPWSAAGWFVPVLGGCGLLAAGLTGFGWWQGRTVDPLKAAKLAGDAAAREALAAAEQAVGAGDTAGFFAAAREALRIQVAERSGIRPEAVTLADLRGIEDGEIVELLKVADRVDYSGRATEVGSLPNWKEKLHRGLARLAEKRDVA